MGLDIHAYRKLTKLDALLNEDGEWVDAKTRVRLYCYMQVYANRQFQGREAPLKDGAVYAYDEECVVLSASYGSYNRWREELAKLAGYPLTEYKDFLGLNTAHAAACWAGATGPFSELINFADNEGCIGSNAAAKLLIDFNEWDERAKSVHAYDFYEHYTAIRRGLELAADGGALAFR